MKSEKRSKRGIQAIARAAAILRALRRSASGLSLGQIASRTGLPRSTVQRIVAALVAERLAVRTGDGIRLGPGAAELSEAARSPSAAICRAALIDLSRKLAETVDLSELRGAGMYFVDQLPGALPLRAVSAVGEIFPLTRTANGRAALALMDRARARDLVMAEWTRLGARGDWPMFSAMLDAIARSGLAYDLDEHMKGISAVGAGFADADGGLHAVSVPIPSARFAIKRAATEAALAQAMDRIRPLVA